MIAFLFKDDPFGKAFSLRTLGKWEMVGWEPQGPPRKDLPGDAQQVPLPALQTLASQVSNAWTSQEWVRVLWVSGMVPHLLCGLPGPGPSDGPGVTWREGKASWSRGPGPVPQTPLPVHSPHAETARSPHAETAGG